MNLFAPNMIFHKEVGWLVKESVKADIQDQIESFSELPDGWHYGEGCGATEYAVKQAIGICSQLLMHNIEEMEVFPGIHGGISVFGYRDEHVFEVFCDQNGFIDILHEVNGNTSYEQDYITLHEVVSYLRRLPWMAELLASKSLLGFSTQNCLIKSYDASQVMLSPSHHTTEEYQSYLQDVPGRTAAPNAGTFFTITTPIYRGPHQSYGELTPPTYLLKPA